MLPNIQPAFASLAFAKFVGGYRFRDNVTTLFVGSPTDAVLRIVNAASAAGSILPITPPGTNATWETTMLGPRLSCESMDGNTYFLSDLKDNLQAQLRLSSNGTGDEDSGGPIKAFRMFPYLAWANTTTDSRVPFAYTKSNISTGTMDLQGTAGPGNETDSRDLYLAVFPSVFDAAHTAGGFFSEPLTDYTQDIMDQYFVNITTIHCGLEAAEYSLRFTYNGTDQAQYIEVLTTKTQPIPRARTLALDLDGGDSTLSYYSAESGQGGTEHDGRDLRTASFQAIWQSFQTLIVGQINNMDFMASLGESGTSYENQDSFTSRVLSTSLAESTELNPLVLPSRRIIEADDSNDKAPYRQMLGLLGAAFESTASRKSLKDSLEELFFNVSISMANSPDLLYVTPSPSPSSSLVLKR